jgi:pyruvate, orthophosphate dikinase
MAGMPVTLRLLDPPLHEFLPSRDHEFVDTARALGIEVESLRIRVEAMREVNPMLGHRGCRLAISHPEILDMQARAIFEAAMNVEDQSGRVIEPEIMIPFVSAAEEVRVVRARIERMADVIASERGRKPHYSVGTMIELPRAALGADRIAKECTFFSFGTNDLTQTTYGISRDDSSPFLALYRERRVFQDDPFQKFDVIGAGELMRIATEKGRKERPDITIGVCGEHGGEPGSIAFFDSLGHDYVSCSPYRVPIARLAAAQAAIRRKAKH